MTDFAPLDPLLRVQLAGGQLSHAYIFQGAAADRQALSLAAFLCCKNENGEKPCMRCPACRNILAGTFPDCRVVEPDNGAIKIDATRAVGFQAQLAAVDGGWKVFIIRQAERMTAEAANNLLKLLEEPPAQTMFILVSQQPEQLLSTIISRCQVFVFGENMSRIETVPDPGLLAEAEQFLRDLPRIQIYEVLLLSREREKREEQHDFLYALLHVLHKAAVGKLQLPMSYGHLLRSETMVESSLELMDNNVNQKLLTDVVYLRLWQNSQS